MNDTNVHKINIYCMDWDSTGRRETIVVKDAASGTVLDTRSLTSSFNAGVWLSWTFRGSVRFEVTNNGAPNAVVQGMFFDESPLVYDFSGNADGGTLSCYAY